MRVGRRLHISWPTTTLFRWPRGRRRNIFSAIRRDLVNGWTPANDVRLSLDCKHRLLLLVVVGVVQRPCSWTFLIAWIIGAYSAGSNANTWRSWVRGTWSDDTALSRMTRGLHRSTCSLLGFSHFQVTTASPCALISACSRWTQLKYLGPVGRSIELVDMAAAALCKSACNMAGHQISGWSADFSIDADWPFIWLECYAISLMIFFLFIYIFFFFSFFKIFLNFFFFF